MIIVNTTNHTHCCSLGQNDYCTHHQPHTLLLSRAEWLLKTPWTTHTAALLGRIVIEDTMNHTHCCSLELKDYWRHHEPHTLLLSRAEWLLEKKWTTHTAALWGRIIIVDTMNHTHCCSLGQNDYWGHHEPHTLLLSRAEWLLKTPWTTHTAAL